MNTLFPFGMPFPTAFYLTLYVVTLVLHVVFMNYVLAGTCLLAVNAVTKHKAGWSSGHSPLAYILRDWMPFALSAAITAGVAPLLFVQVLYKQGFYTANLLSMNRWMAILPVLIVGFYALYVLKTKWAETHPARRTLVAFLAAACFLFTAVSWTENHLLSIAGQQTWTHMYEAGQRSHFVPELVPRLLMWTIGAFPTMAVLLAWQARGAIRRGRAGPTEDSPAINEADARRIVPFLAAPALIGMVLAAACGGWYVVIGGPTVSDALTGALSGPYAAAAAVGALLQGGAWIVMLRRRALRRAPLIAASAGLGLTLLGMTVAREAVRMERVDISTLFDQHARILREAGVAAPIVFVVFAAVCLGAIVWCIRAVASHRRAADA